MAVVDVWSWTIKPGKHEDALAVLKKAQDYHVSHGTKSRLLWPISGLRLTVYVERSTSRSTQ